VYEHDSRAPVSGATLVLAPSADINTVLDLIEATRPEVIPLVPPTLAIRLLEAPRNRETDLSSIKDFIVGGQKMSVDVAERLRVDSLPLSNVGKVSK
jgi:2,3-dihydroxybenzoate-AMP ligase